MAGIGSQTIVVVLNLHFDVIGGALLSSAQALHVKTEERACETDVQQPTHTTLPTPTRNLKTVVIRLNTHLALWPAHSLQHLLAKFGVIFTPGAVPGVDRPLLFPLGWRQRAATLLRNSQRTYRSYVNDLDNPRKPRQTMSLHAL